MMNTSRRCALGLVVMSTALSAQAPSASPTPAAPVKATLQNAGAFVGEWDLNGMGPNGPASFTLVIKPEGQTLTAVLTMGGAPQKVNEISMLGTTLSLDVVFINSGTYPAVVTLTPSNEFFDKVVLHIEVANGLAQLVGTATTKIHK